MSVSLFAQNKQTAKDIHAPQQPKKDAALLQSQATVKKLMMSMGSDEEDMQDGVTHKRRKESVCSLMSDHLFDGFDELISSKLKKKPSLMEAEPLQNLKSEIKRAKMALVKEVVIVSSSRIRPLDFFSDLMTYWYSKAKRHLFGESEENLNKNKHYHIVALLDLYSKFGSQKENKLYIVSNQSVFYFSHDKSDRSTNLLAFCPDERLSETIDTNHIHYDKLPISLPKGEMLLIQNRYINVFWNDYMSEIIRTDTAFEVAANYDFACSFKVSPREVFNGPENRESYRAAKEFQGCQRLFHLKMNGFLFQDNLKALQKSLRKKFGKEFYFELAYVEGTQQFNSSLQKFLGKSEER